MICERCKINTDIIKHIKLKCDGSKKEWFVCINCYNDCPKLYVKEEETIKNDVIFI